MPRELTHADIPKTRRSIRELSKAEVEQVAGGAQPNQNAGGGPGNSGPGDKHSPVQGPPPGRDPQGKQA
jgi:hypothetical protein